MSWKECPKCTKKNVYCIDSRWSLDRTRRRYECLNKKCGHRFTTIELIADVHRGKRTHMGRRLQPKHVINAKDAIDKAIDRTMKRIFKEDWRE